MDIVTLIKSIPETKDKNPSYFQFKGLVFTLKPEEVVKVLDINFTQDVLKRDVILSKILSDLGITQEQYSRRFVLKSSAVTTEIDKVYIELFLKLFNLIQKTDEYRLNQAIAKFLYRMCEAMPEEIQTMLIDYFLTSRFKNNQNRAIFFLKGNWWKDYERRIVQFWKETYHDDCLGLIIEKIDKKTTSKISDLIHNYFLECEDVYGYDWQLKILRNKFYIIFAEKYKKEIQKLKKSDPISYIFITKGNGKKIDKDFAIEIYNKYVKSRTYLPRWYAEMEMLDVLEEIIKNPPPTHEIYN